MNNDSFLKKIINGIFGLVGTSVINKVVAFLSNLLIVWIISKKEYGIFTSANNNLSIIMLFTGLGTLTGALQYGSENRSEEEKKEYFKFCLQIGLIFDFVLSICLVVVSLMGLFPSEKVGYYTILLTPTLLLHYLFEYFNCILRSKKLLKEYIICVNANSFSNALLSCVGAYFWGIEGLVIGRCVSYCIGIIFGGIFLRGEIKGILSADKLNKLDRTELMKYSLSCCLIAALNRALYLIDVAIITYLINDSEQVATYKVGTQIPEALEFIPQSILVAIVPYIAEHNADITWLRKWTSKLYIYSGIINVVVVAILLIFSKYAIMMYGKKYLDSISVFNLLTISYFFLATFRQTGTNIISALRKTNYNLIISIITLVINCIIDIIFVKLWGINGAAIATLLSVIVASSLSFPYVIYLIYSSRGNEEIVKNKLEDNNID